MQAKYKKQHVDSYAKYKDDLKKFYDSNPDARELLDK